MTTYVSYACDTHIYYNYIALSEYSYISSYLGNNSPHHCRCWKLFHYILRALYGVAQFFDT